MNKNLYSKLMSRITSAIILMVLVISGNVMAQGWSIYDASVFPNEITPAFVTASSSFSANENQIIDDPDVLGNKLLWMDVSGNPNAQFLWRMNFANHNIDVDALTIIMKVKGHADRDMTMDLDMEHNGSRSRVSLHTATKLARIRNGSGTNATLTENLTEWNVYRFTMTTTQTRLYINEEPDPVLEFTPATGTNRHFRFGDGDGSASLGADIDWVIWDVSGAYAPGEGTAIPGSLATPSWNASLSELKVDGVDIEDFKANLLSYEVVLPAGTTEVPEVTALVADPEADVVITPAIEIPGSTTVVVTAENGSTTKTYTVAFRNISDVATLSQIGVDGEAITGFDPEVLVYNVNLPLETAEDVPVVTAVATGPNAEVVITEATELPGQTTIVVTAEDGITELTYHVNFQLVSTDATLSDLLADGTTIPGFDSEVTEYQVFYPVGTTDVPVISAVTNQEDATVVITQATEFPGVATVVVTAEDGETELTYTINILAGSSDATLADLLVDGVTIVGFDEDVLEYFLVYPAGTTDVPEITAEATDENANVVITEATGIPGVTTIVVTAEDNFTVLTYTVNIRNISENADLSDLLVNGTTVTGFDPDVLSYDVVLSAGTVDVPVVTAVAADEYASVDIDPVTALPGSATVVVTAEDDETEKTYVINFTVKEGPLAWRVYDARVLPDANVPLFDESNVVGIGGTNVLVTDPDDSENSFLEMITVGVADNFMWRTPLQPETPGLTMVMKVKAANDVARRVVELDIHHNGIRERLYINREANRVRLNESLIVGQPTDPPLTGDAKEIPAPDGVSFSDWNIYRITKSGGEIKLYINENPVPIAEGTTVTTTTQQYFRFGVGNSSHNIAALIDWIIWDETGAYAPGEGSAIPANVVTPNWDATISELLVDGTLIAGFDPEQTEYDIVLADGTTDIPVISATINNPEAEMVVTQATELPGLATVEVTAVNGFTVYTYNVTLRFISSNAELAEILLGTASLADFDPDVLVYNVVLPVGATAAPVVSAVAAHTNATVEVTQAGALPGAATIKVTAEDGTTVETYTINFTISTSVSELNVIGFRMYPNPATTQLHLELEDVANGKLLQIVNTNGQIVLVKNLGSVNEVVDISRLVPGTYIIMVSSENSHTRKLLIKQ